MAKNMGFVSNFLLRLCLGVCVLLSRNVLDALGCCFVRLLFNCFEWLCSARQHEPRLERVMGRSRTE